MYINTKMRTIGMIWNYIKMWSTENNCKCTTASAIADNDKKTRNGSH